MTGTCPRASRPRPQTPLASARPSACRRPIPRPPHSGQRALIQTTPTSAAARARSRTTHDDTAAHVTHAPRAGASRAGCARTSSREHRPPAPGVEAPDRGGALPAQGGAPAAAARAWCGAGGGITWRNCETCETEVTLSTVALKTLCAACFISSNIDMAAAGVREARLTMPTDASPLHLRAGAVRGLRERARRVARRRRALAALGRRVAAR